ncbi:sensor histidine kinase [Candidatus Methylospira mobilis]|uniref:histidine kinase n=1 Tax=Candidatus Methylospira mobilis TaxID=1808979 RepID=A0A5Q0BJQ2_9GAMM|nr:sensor histidine kinase [Candidatus Methylospira mobilis]QFY42388.1 sensor histidine kinase [Candidatus Methylospira mobilis]
MKTLWSLLLWVSLLAATLDTVSAEEPPLVLSSGSRHASLAGHMALYVDAQGTLPFEEATQAEYTPLAVARSAGYTPDTHWYRFTLIRSDDAAHDWILALGMATLDDVRIWVVAPGTPIRQYRLGDHIAYEQRPLKTRLFTLPLEMKAGGPVTVYVRVSSIGAINFSAEIWQPADFITNETRANFYSGLYFGILLIIIVIFLLIGAWLRDVSMVIYAAYVGSLFMLHLGMYGYTAVVFAPQSPWANDAIVGGGAAAGLGLTTLLWRYLLDLKNNFPSIDRLYRVITVCCVCALPFAASSYYRVIASTMILVSMGITFINLVLVIKLWLRQRKIELLIYFFAFVVANMGIRTYMAMMMGWLPNNVLTVHAYQTSAMIQVLVISLGLAMRIRKIQYDKMFAEQLVAVTDQRMSEQRRFVAMLSHEFRNPLAAIDRAAQMLRIKLPDMAQPEAGRVENIRSHAAALSTLVDNLLMSEALDHKALAIAREHCAIRPLLEDVIQTLGETPGVRVMLTVTPPDAAFSLDPTLMGMAVGNLLDNALRYSPQEAPVELSAMLDANGLLIQVTDHGSGMSKAEFSMLGMPYYRGASSSGQKGSGLGFHFSRKVVDAHGGNLQALACPEGGMKVVLRLSHK